MADLDTSVPSQIWFWTVHTERRFSLRLLCLRFLILWCVVVLV